MRVNGGDLFRHVFHRRFLELRHAQPGVTRLDHLGLHALHTDFLANDGGDDRLIFFLARDRQCDLGIRLAAHLLDGFVQRHALDRRAVEARDQIARLQACLVCGGILDRRDDFDVAVFHADFDSKTDEFALRAFTQFLECFFVQICRVRIERGHHARDRLGQQLLVFDRFDIVGFDQAEHVSQLSQFIDWQWRTDIFLRQGVELH